MMIVIAALSFAIATYLWIVGSVLPQRFTLTPTVAAHKKTRTVQKPQGWSITRRSLNVLNMSQTKFKIISWISAGVVGFGWILIVENIPAGLIMAILGYQLPGLIVEMFATKQLDLLQRQVSIFVGTVNDALHGQGATPEDALLIAARSVQSGPLLPIAEAYLRRTEAHISFNERGRLMAELIDLPSFNFFVELMRLRESTGAEKMARAFESLDEKMQDDERIQTMIHGELSMYMMILVLGLLVDMAIFPIYRISSANWLAIKTHLGILISLTAVSSVIVFSGIRKFARARVVSL